MRALKKITAEEAKVIMKPGVPVSSPGVRPLLLPTLSQFFSALGHPEATHD